MNFKKSGRFFSGKSCPRGFGAPGCHPGTLIDLVNTALASKISVQPKCMISEGYRTHGGVTGPMKFKKRTFFFRKIVLPGFGAPGCNLNALIELANNVLGIRGPVKPICLISKGYRTNKVVTGPMNFKKSGRFFFGKSCSRDFGAPGCSPGTLIDLVNTALDSKNSVETICMIWEGCRTHRVVTGPMKFKKRTFFFRKIMLPGFWGPWLPVKHFN